MSLATAAAWTPRPPAPWMTHAVAEAHARHVETVDHLGERAVHARHRLVGELVGHLEDRAARTEVVVVREGAVQVREGAGPERPLDLVRTGGGLLVEAGVAAAARVEVRVGDAVAFLERAAERVGRDLRRRAWRRGPSSRGRRSSRLRGRRSGASPRQKWRSEPQTLAWVTRIRTPSGSTSGMGTSRISKGLPGPKNSAALAVAGMEGLLGRGFLAELEGVVERAHGELGVLVLDDARDGDLGGRDHLDVDVLLR